MAPVFVRVAPQLFPVGGERADAQVFRDWRTLIPDLVVLRERVADREHVVVEGQGELVPRFPRLVNPPRPAHVRAAGNPVGEVRPRPPAPRELLRAVVDNEQADFMPREQWFPRGYELPVLLLTARWDNYAPRH